MECLDKFLFSDITKPRTPSTQLHPPPPSSLQHPHQYSNRNIARNWAISPNLGQKIQSCPFWLKNCSHGILKELIPNADIDFWNSNSKSIFGQIWAQNNKVVRFVWKLAHMVSQRCWFLFQHYFSKIPTSMLDKWDYCCNQNLSYQKSFASTKTLK